MLDSKTDLDIMPSIQEPSAWWKELRWPRWFPHIAGVLLIFVLIFGIFNMLAAVGSIFRPVFVPLLISLGLAYLLKPFVDWIEAKQVSRRNAVLLAMLGTTVVLLFLLLFLIPNIWLKLAQVTTQIPSTAKSINEWIRPRLETLHSKYPNVYDKIAHKLLEHFQNPSGIEEYIANGIKSTFSNVLEVSASVLNLILIPFFTYYILKDIKLLSGLIVKIVPPRYQTVAKYLMTQTSSVLSNFVRGQIIVCSGMSILYIIAFLIIGVPIPISLGILSGFGHLIPYVGTFTAAILTVGLTSMEQPSLFQMLMVISTYPIVQSIEGFILTPYILGERLDLHPFVVIVGLIIGHSLFGILGIILTVPVLATGKICFSFLHEIYEQSGFYKFLPHTTMQSADK